MEQNLLAPPNPGAKFNKANLPASDLRIPLAPLAIPSNLLNPLTMLPGAYCALPPSP